LGVCTPTGPVGKGQSPKSECAEGKGKGKEKKGRKKKGGKKRKKKKRKKKGKEGKRKNQSWKKVSERVDLRG